MHCGCSVPGCSGCSSLPAVPPSPLIPGIGHGPRLPALHGVSCISRRRHLRPPACSYRLSEYLVFAAACSMAAGRVQHGARCGPMAGARAEPGLRSLSLPGWVPPASPRQDSGPNCCVIQPADCCPKPLPRCKLQRPLTPLGFKFPIKVPASPKCKSGLSHRRGQGTCPHHTPAPSLQASSCHSC